MHLYCRREGQHQKGSGRAAIVSPGLYVIRADFVPAGLCERLRPAHMPAVRWPGSAVTATVAGAFRAYIPPESSEGACAGSKKCSAALGGSRVLLDRLAAVLINIDTAHTMVLYLTSIRRPLLSGRCRHTWAGGSVGSCCLSQARSQIQSLHHTDFTAPVDSQIMLQHTRRWHNSAPQAGSSDP